MNKTSKLKKAQYIALGASIASIIGYVFTFVYVSDFGGYLMLIGLIGAIVSYCYGGFKQAASMAGKIAKFGWVITPFPIDILTFLITLMIAIYVFLFIPFIPVRKAYKESLQ